jgi:formylmethanofuran dehydrogenase subunit E
MPPDLDELVIGKASICWNCGNEFVLDEENMKKDNPICADCDSTKAKIGNLLSSLGVE